MDHDQLSYLLLASLVSLSMGSLGHWLYNCLKLKGYKRVANEILKRAEIDAENFRKSAELEAKQYLIEEGRKADQLWQNERKKIQKEDERIKLREDKLEGRFILIERKVHEIEKRESDLQKGKLEQEEREKSVRHQKTELIHELEKVSGLSSHEAKDLLLNKVMNDVKTEALNLTRRVQKEAEEESERVASSIIATAINRLTLSCVSESTVTTVAIPSDEMKGRIIGREGRNIRTLERLTGVNFIIDDTPGAVVLSGFDPIRLNIAKLALTDLIQDGRIHPTRIEEVVEKATANTQKQIRHYGEDAALRAGAMNLHPELILLLGRLKFRFSYGQNILDHSLEVSYLMGIMADEIGLDAPLARRIGLLHDMGKALSHEIQGSHAIIGYDFALKYGERIEVANGIGCHHEEMEPITIEGSLCSAADRISASRPGARIEAVEEYIKRLKRLEDLGFEFPGVERVYAMQAGREVRVIVVPDAIDDEGIQALAKEMTRRIEKELSYPGKIKVIVIREKRAIEYAV